MPSKLILERVRSSYVSAKLIDLLRLKPIATLTRSIDLLMSTEVATLEEYDLSFRSVNHQFTLRFKGSTQCTFPLMRLSRGSLFNEFTLKHFMEASP